MVVGLGLRRGLVVSRLETKIPFSSKQKSRTNVLTLVSISGRRRGVLVKPVRAKNTGICKV